ncbi:glycosyltransferase family 39 protein [Streptomyces sp. NBC_01381]|uniref:glycosyltransferase family 39 protein n=1 Tax=Streptomyces sp. NBC_01381 TaxID=2903845 RepID=UPI00224E4311|nr:glycosyltransferase family 39 protein [Streptomyces sp. NBC_01381]MCX4671377.1 glycosyltransferase family 39 protein [Streptomyces sp. NBC_01381]
MLLTLALGLWGVRRGGSMWRDEAVTYDVAHRGLSDLWHTLGNADAVHGLYYLLMYGLYGICELFGRADPLLVMRIPSVLAMSVATAGVAMLGRHLAGPRAGLLAGAVFAVIPSIQRFAQEGRSYAMVCALVVWATYVLVRAASADGRRARRLWRWYGALMLVTCLLHEFAVFALPAHALTVPWTARRPWARAAAVVVTGLAPLAVLSQRQKEQVGWLHVDLSQYAGATGLCVAGVVCAALLGRLGGRAADAGRPIGLRRPALALLVTPTLALLLIAPVKPLYADRYVLYGIAGLALLIGALLDQVSRGGRRRTTIAVVAAAAALIALAPYSAHLRTPDSRLDNTAAVTQALQDAGSEGDAVLYMPLRRRVWSLPHPQAVAELDDLALDRRPAPSHTLYGTEVGADVIRARMLTRTRIVFVTDPSRDPVDQIPRETVKRDVLKDHFEQCHTRSDRGWRVTLYARPGHCPASP